MTIIAKGDFIEMDYTGRSNGNVFDSTKEADIKQLDSEAKPTPLRLIVGQGMVVPGLDKDLEGKEVGKEYTVHIAAKDGFGPRHANLIRPIPLSVFTAKRLNPQPGMSLVLDNSIVNVRAVSGARVIVDFNNPLAGRDLDYQFTVTKKLDDVSDKTKIFFERVVRFVPEYEVGATVVVKGAKQMEPIIKILGAKFKELVGKELEFKEVAPTEKKAPVAKDGTQQSL